MNACHGAQPGQYVVFLSQKSGQTPHENEYPYKYDEPALKCPLNAKIFNSGAKVTEGLRD